MNTIVQVKDKKFALYISEETIKAKGIVIEISSGDLKSFKKKNITRIAKMAPTTIFWLKLSIE
jgi:hypothetical protein